VTLYSSFGEVFRPRTRDRAHRMASHMPSKHSAAIRLSSSGSIQKKRPQLNDDCRLVGHIIALPAPTRLPDSGVATRVAACRTGWQCAKLGGSVPNWDSLSWKASQRRLGNLARRVISMAGDLGIPKMRSNRPGAVGKSGVAVRRPERSPVSYVAAEPESSPLFSSTSACSA
jgi:hypothetical protein